MTFSLPKWLSFTSGSLQFLFHAEPPRLLVSCGQEAAVYFFDPAELSPSMAIWLREAVMAHGYRARAVTVQNRHHLPQWLKGSSGTCGVILHPGTPPFLAMFSDARMEKVVWLDGCADHQDRDEFQRCAQTAWLAGNERSLIT